MTLSAVSCPSTNSCFIVGEAYAGQETNQTLVEHWDGTTWSIMQSPAPLGPSGWSSRVSSRKHQKLLAVGTFSSAPNGHVVWRALVEYWDGATGRSFRAPNVSYAVTELSGVSCLGANNCYAVGNYYASIPSVYTIQTLVEHWNGTNWTVMPTPRHSSNQVHALNRVTCQTATSCFAVGVSDDAVLVEHWNGTSWSVMDSPTLAGGSLSDVACHNTTCFAVGSANSKTWSSGIGNPKAAREAGLNVRPPSRPKQVGPLG